MAVKKKAEEVKTEYVFKRGKGHCGHGGGTYGVGFVGALIYFIHHSTSFGMGVLGVIKALVWPALVVYKLLEFLKL